MHLFHGEGMSPASKSALCTHAPTVVNCAPDDAAMGEASPGPEKASDSMQITPAPSFMASSPRPTSVSEMIKEIEQRCAEIDEPELRQVLHV